MDVFKQGPIELRLGRWQDVLSDVSECDAVIVDSPYSILTHEGHNRRSSPDKRKCTRRDLSYIGWSGRDVATFVRYWATKPSRWFVAFTDDVLAPSWRSNFDKRGLYPFAPVVHYSSGSRVRLSGDGPSCWVTWIMTARPKTREAQRCGTLPGGYRGPSAPGHIGGKPLWLMRAIIRDYTKPGDLVVDPCAGGATTLIAAAIEGRRAIGAECDPETFGKAVARIECGWTPDLFAGTG